MRERVLRFVFNDLLRDDFDLEGKVRSLLHDFGDEKWPWLVTGWLPPAKRLVKVKVGAEWSLSEYVTPEGVVTALPSEAAHNHRTSSTSAIDGVRRTWRSGRVLSGSRLVACLPTASAPSTAGRATSSSSLAATVTPAADPTQPNSSGLSGSEGLSRDFAATFGRLQVGDQIVSIDGIPLHSAAPHWQPWWRPWRRTDALQRALRSARRGRELERLARVSEHLTAGGDATVSDSANASAGDSGHASAAHAAVAHASAPPASYDHIVEIRERRLHKLEEAVLAISRASIEELSELSNHLSTGTASARQTKAELDKRLSTLDAKLDAKLVSPLGHLWVLQRELVTREALDLVAHSIARNRKAELSVKPPRRPRKKTVGDTIGSGLRQAAATPRRIARHVRTNSNGSNIDLAELRRGHRRTTSGGSNIDMAEVRGHRRTSSGGSNLDMAEVREVHVDVGVSASPSPELVTRGGRGTPLPDGADDSGAGALGAC